MGVADLLPDTAEEGAEDGKLGKLAGELADERELGEGRREPRERLG